MRLRNREVLPLGSGKQHADTPTRSRFYYAWDHQNDIQPTPALRLFKQLNIPKSTVYDWLACRMDIGDIAARRHDGRVEKQLLRESQGSGRPLKITDEQLQQLLDADQETRRQPLRTQLVNSSIEANHCTLQRALHTRADAGMFRASTQKAITDPQASQRRNYCITNQHQPVIGYWDGVQFTEEAHMALDDFSAE